MCILFVALFLVAPYGFASELDIKQFQKPADLSTVKFAKTLARQLAEVKQRTVEAPPICITKEHEDFARTLVKNGSSIVKGKLEIVGGNDPSDLYIFTSLGLGERYLKQVIEEAKRYNGVIVIRGLIKGSVKETIKYLAKFMGNEGEGLIIDPNLFRKYKITQVPTFVLTKGEEGSDTYDILRGNVTLNYVLTQISLKGDLSDDAKERLR